MSLKPVLSGFSLAFIGECDEIIVIYKNHLFSESFLCQFNNQQLSEVILTQSGIHPSTPSKNITLSLPLMTSLHGWMFSTSSHSALSPYAWPVKSNTLFVNEKNSWKIDPHVFSCPFLATFSHRRRLKEVSFTCFMTWYGNWEFVLF